MKKYQILGVAMLATFAIAGAQEGTGVSVNLSADVKASTTMPRPKPMPPVRQEVKEMRGEMREERQEIMGERKEIMNTRVEMRASNTVERKDLRVETRDMMKNATSVEDRKEVRNNQMEKRGEMRASNTEDRKELNQKSKELAKVKITAIVEKLKLVTSHLEKALTRTETFVANKKASSTVDMSKTEGLLAIAKTSLAKVKTDVAAVEIYANVEVTSDNRDMIRSVVKTAQDSIKSFQDSLKNVLETIRTPR
jgi:hypothetical protein